MIKAAVALLFMLGLAGCQTTSQVKPVPVTDPVAEALLEAAQRIERQNLQLMRIEEAASETQVVTHEPPTSGPLTRAMTIRWTGPIAPLVEMIGQQLGWKVLPPAGNPPTPPRVVVIDAVDRPAFEVLESVGVQAGRSVGLVVDAQRQRLQVVYFGRDR